MRRSDAGLIAMYTADERVARGTRSIPHPLPPGISDNFVARAMEDERNEDVWIIDGAQNGDREVLGVISLTHLEREQSQLGYWVAPAFWNAGVASAAVDALLRANPQDSRVAFASVFQDNAASARVLTNCGFQYLGDAEAFSVARNAKVPTWTYSKKLG